MKEELNKTYKYDDIIQKVLDYFDGDELAANVWIQKYSLKNNKGEILEQIPTETHKRMAKEFARIENKYRENRSEYTVEIFKSLSKYGQNRKRLTEERILDYFDHFKYIVPQGSVMASLGNPYNYSSLSNCVVIPEMYDSYGGIMYADQQLAQLFKRRCGVGLDLSTLRPTGALTNNSAGSSTGAISFMERFSNTTREVAQSGRRGALMLTIDIKHPNVEDFITIKEDLKKVTGANISVKLSDEFMNAVKNDTDFTLQFPIHSETPDVTKIVKAKELWNKIVIAARNSAEPGLIFWDRQHWYSTSSVYPEYKNISTNPCLTGDAKVNTNFGNLTMKEIFEDIDIFGSLQSIECLSYNKKTKKIEYKKITRSLLTHKNANVIEIILNNGYKLKCTPDHKIFTENRGFVEAIKLNKDDVLLTNDNEIRSNFSSYIECESEDVYDITVEDNHNFFANGILVSNCGEIAMGNDSCRLIALNMFGCVVNPFTGDAKFDFEKWYEISYEGQRLNDDLVDLELESIEKILKKIDDDPEPDFIKEVERRTWQSLYDNGKNGRRTGLGFTAMGDVLAALNLKYDTDEAINMIEKIMKKKCEAEFDSSIDMAIERGKFKEFDTKIENESHFVQMLQKELPEVYVRMMAYGRRNISLSTCAPNGSISLLTRTTSGVEPLFMIEPYQRRKKVLNDDKFDFQDELGDKWQVFDVYHPKLKMYLDLNPGKNVYDSAYVSAAKIDWKKRVEIQGVIQKYVTHSISSCLSLDSLIDTDDGLFYLDELYNFDTIKENEFQENDIIKSKVLNHKNERVNITSFYNNGTKVIFETELDNGLKLKSTGNEKVIYLNENDDIEEWKMILELNIGDRIKITK